MKTLALSVDLKIFEDEESEIWGLTHKNTYNVDNPFDSIWSGMMIFHDVFEHWFEKEHEYFKGKDSMNVGGEMSAMGAMWYYYSELGMHNRLPSNSYHPPCEMMKQTTMDMVEEAIHEGYCNYGETLECGVPYQSPVDNGELEYQIEDFANQVKGFNFNCNDLESSKVYKDSVTSKKIKSLHRWGYKMAEKLVPDNYSNQDTLIEFKNFWDTFCEKNNAEELYNYFSGITFNIYKENGVISWTATLNGSFNGYGTTEDYIISSENLNYVPDTESIINESIPVEEEEEY